MKTLNLIQIPASLLIILGFTLFITSGCDKAVTQVEPRNSDNIVVLTANEIFQTQNGVVVDGETVFINPFRPDSSINFHDESIYRYHTQITTVGGEVVTTDWIRRFLGFNITLNRASRRFSPGTKFVFDHLDIGDLTLESIALNSISEGDVDFGETADSLLDIINFKSYWYHVFQSETNSQGNTFVTLDSQLRDIYESRESFTLSGTNSPEVEDFTIQFSVEPPPALITIENGDPILFREEIPRITASQDLVITFDRPLPAGEAFMMLVPVPVDTGITVFNDVREKSAFVSIIEDTDQIILTSDILQTLKANSNITSELYSMSVISRSSYGDLTFSTHPENSVESYRFPVFVEGITEMHLIFNN